MWIIAKHGFLSIVQHDDDPDMLLVRGRVEGDIEYYFPEAEVTRNDKADYLYRATIDRGAVEDAIARAVYAIDYRAVKPAIADKRRTMAYLAVWQELEDMQEDLKEDDSGIRADGRKAKNA